MSALDDQFYETLRMMEALSAEALLSDTFPPQNSHNNSARILRLGLAVSAFALLEKYIEGKFDELMQQASACVIPYASFPDGFRQFITTHAVGGLANRASFLDRGDALTFVESAIARVSAFGAVPPGYTALGFSPRGSNVGDRDIEAAFAAVGVAGVWATLSAITHELGGGRVSLKSDYRNLARTRHRSAHNASHNVPTADLVTHIRTATIFGVAVAILTTVVGRAYRFAATKPQLAGSLNALAREYRFLDEEASGTWIERTDPAGRAIKRYPDRDAAVAGARLRTGTRFIVFRDKSRVPVGVV